ncbi:MAG: hypothetical protein WA814_11980 [Candidatus Baltobacteraceae bacterium]
MKADLLYVSDGNGEVSVYRYWKQSLYGILTGFTQPMGMCVDRVGNVYITDYAAQQVLEYAHAGTKAIDKLDTAPYGPYGCSVNPTNGDLAIAEVAGGSRSGGNIAIYAHASGEPAYYTDPNLPAYESCAYDSDGNLLVTNGTLPNYRKIYFAWLPSGGKELIDIYVPGPSPSWTWYDVEGVQWDGKYFVIDDQTAVFRVALLKGQMFYVGESYFNIEDPVQYWVYNNNPKQQGTQIVATYSSGVAYYPYPAGGNALHGISHGIDDPYGITVSLKKP